MATHYTTTGSVRGDCGHRHRSLMAAERCREADMSGCNRHGGYSDRKVVGVDPDGSTRRLTEDEWMAIGDAHEAQA